MYFARTVFALCSAVLLLLAETGCSGTGKGANAPSGPTSEAVKPVTLTMYFKCFAVSDDDFARDFAGPVAKKYPHITLQKLDCTDANQFNQMIVAKELPDIIDDGITNMPILLDMDVPTDLNELVRKYEFNLGGITPQILQFFKQFGRSGELYSLPRTQNVFATYYNKDLFDKFGAAYPVDGMTWEQYIELAKKLTVVEKESRYYGLQMGYFNRVQTQLSLPFADPATGKAQIQQQPGWRSMFSLFQTVFNIPNNRPPTAGVLYQGSNRFTKDRNVAIFPDIFIGQAMEPFNKEGIGWDIASFPVFADKPKTGIGVFANGFVIPKTSKHKEEAFQAIAHLLSPEVQAESTRNGNMTVLDSKDIKQRFLENSPVYRGKNIPAFYYNNVAEPYATTKYDLIASNLYTDALRQFIFGTKDLNTVLREAEEAADRAIAAERAK
ncbi:extracellular solute-binding protein [Paenibacillus ginsengarvi]|uniref:Extracellular solute-binding protein n=1 Tax=Paenibacillus ginsengarvi TaxID=400777 RepID=A0A3B0C7K6_9BACL|nr:extracellular solute-binding protein [Paenibacillus ginsengarvi]RKN78996.1 extracellular solute-binding protein [Paenibacillus ginsengarvi]